MRLGVFLDELRCGLTFDEFRLGVLLDVLRLGVILYEFRLGVTLDEFRVGEYLTLELRRRPLDAVLGEAEYTVRVETLVRCKV